MVIHQFIRPDRYGYGFLQGSAIVVVLLFLACAPVEKQQERFHDSLVDGAAYEVVKVDARETIRHFTEHPVGINLNYLMDDDALLNPETGIVESLKALGVKYLRYPGGEKSDSYLWTVPPWPNSATEKLKPMLARTGPNEWPANSKFTLADMETLVPEVLDFDEFMSVCRAIDCEPVLVVPADSPYVPSRGGGKIPTREQLIENATEWVRYANLTRSYGIKYWMIGNETWNLTITGGTEAKTYARDLVDFSVAMKTIDPSIKIIANGYAESWWREILQTASGHIDYLGVSNYPLHAWKGFETYQAKEIEFDRAVKVAISAIEKFAPSTDANRLEVIVSETNVIDWSKRGWENRNDLGHALVLFQMIGDVLLEKKVPFFQYWTTRWIDDDSLGFPRVFDAIDQNGRFQATGMTLAIWGNYLFDTMISTVGSKDVKTYGTLNTKTDRLNLFLLNKNSHSRPIAIAINGHQRVGTVTRKSLSGTGPEDIKPNWRTGTEELVDGELKFILPAVSITILELPAYSAGSVAVPK